MQCGCGCIQLTQLCVMRTPTQIIETCIGCICKISLDLGQSVLPDTCSSQGALQTALVIFVSFSIALTSVAQMAIYHMVVLFEFQK